MEFVYKDEWMCTYTGFFLLKYVYLFLEVQRYFTSMNQMILQ